MKHLLMLLCFPCLLHAQYIEPNHAAPYHPPAQLSQMQPNFLPSDHYLVYVMQWQGDGVQRDTVNVFEYVRQQGRLHFFGVTNLKKERSYEQANKTFTYNTDRTLAAIRYDMHFTGDPTSTTLAVDSMRYGENGLLSCMSYKCDSAGNLLPLPSVNDRYAYDTQKRFTGMTRDYPGLPHMHMGQKYTVEAFSASGKPLLIYSYSPHDLSQRTAKHVYVYDEQDRLVSNTTYGGASMETALNDVKLYYSRGRMYPDSVINMALRDKGEYKPSSICRYTYSRNNTIARIHTDQFHFSSGNLEFSTVYSYVSIPETGIAAAALVQTDVRIYPNPLNGDLLHVQGISESFTYAVYDIMGHFVTEGTAHNGAIPLSGLKTGTYLLSLNGNKPVRLIKE